MAGRPDRQRGSKASKTASDNCDVTLQAKPSTSLNGKRRVGVVLDHVLHQTEPAVALEREDRFWMKLYCFNWQIAVTNAHNNAVFGLSRDPQASRKTSALRIERLITSHPARRW